MLKSCKYCGRIHDSKFDCGHKRYKPSNNGQDNYRCRSAWTKKSIAIRERDHYLCQVCYRKLYGTYKQYNCDNVSVHHIVPIAEDSRKVYDDTNLITLCDMHHKQADMGQIPRQILLDIAEEQEEKR